MKNDFPLKRGSSVKVAIIHDWITGMRGGERCLEAFLAMYPEADVFTLVHVPGTTTAAIDSRVKGTSFISKLPGVRRYYRALLPFFPLAVRSIKLDGYQLVISLSHAAAKNVNVASGTTHICYCFTPMRYVWDQAPYYFSLFTRVLCAPIFEYLRRWDRKGATTVTHFVAISTFVAARIRLFYGRKAYVLAPPVRTEGPSDSVLTEAERKMLEILPAQFFLCAGALVPYKRIDIAVEAFNRLALPLVVVGTGPELKRLQEIASPNVHFLGAVRDPVLWECFRRCQALIFPGIEDFGIIPVECLASGRPVVGINAGGLRDFLDGYRQWHRRRLVAEVGCGVLIKKRMYGSPDGIVEAVRAFIAWAPSFSPSVAFRQARNFSYQEFYRSWERFCDQIGVDAGARPDSSHGATRDVERQDVSLGGPTGARNSISVMKMVGGTSC